MLTACANTVRIQAQCKGSYSLFKGLVQCEGLMSGFNGTIPRFYVSAKGAEAQCIGYISSAAFGSWVCNTALPARQIFALKEASFQILKSHTIMLSCKNFD